MQVAYKYVENYVEGVGKQCLALKRLRRFTDQFQNLEMHEDEFFEIGIGWQAWYMVIAGFFYLTLAFFKKSSYAISLNF
jgi:hypothetical protein